MDDLRRLLSELSRIERLAEVKTSRALAAIRRYAMSEIAQLRVPNIRRNIPERLINDLRDAMIVSDLVGRKRSLLELRRAKDTTLSLDLFSDTIKTLGEQLSVDIDALQIQYNTQALRVMNDISLHAESELRQALNVTIREGMIAPDAIKYMRLKFDALGISPRNKYSVENIVRTQTALAYNAGRWRTDQDPVIRSIIWGYTYVTVGDDRVREDHKKLDGVTLPKDDPFWRRFWPPNGWSCRCQAIPVFTEEEVKRPPVDVEPDPDFNFNPGVVFSMSG